MNIQSSWVTQGLKTCQVGLRFGGNDVGSIMIEENVVSAAGARNHASEEDLRRMIRDAGFRPHQRDTLYRTSLLHCPAGWFREQTCRDGFLGTTPASALSSFGGEGQRD